MRSFSYAIFALAYLALSGCSGPDDISSCQTALTPLCTVAVNIGGSGTRNISMEDDYLLHVVACEHGNAPFEALKAQAVAARSYAHYMLNNETSVLQDGQAHQVYSCPGRAYETHPRRGEIQRAVEQTRGELVSFNNIVLCAFYVNGGIPSTSTCIPTSSERIANDKFVTYNNTSGRHSSLGSSGNRANHGCMSQHSASCLANKQGLDYRAILRFFYGPVTIASAGSCGGTTDCNPHSPGACPGNYQYCNGSSCSPCGSGYDCDGIGSNGCECPNGCNGSTCSGGTTTGCQPYIAHSCTNSGSFCSGGICQPCPHGSYNCDGTFHCECSGPCSGQSCGNASECDDSTPFGCANHKFCSVGRCVDCPAGSSNCDGIFHCECNSDCNGTACDTGGKVCSPSTPGSCGDTDTYCKAGHCELCPNGYLNCDGVQQCECTAHCVGTSCGGTVTPNCTPRAEICNGKDDDCNSLIDDGNPGGGAVCITGLKGGCAVGVAVCQQGRIYCQQTVNPVAETCDGLDNDCNGETDEGCSGTCTPQAELCNGRDDNCDGQVDEGNPQGGQVCFADSNCPIGVTECTATGLRCMPSAQTEVCDGLDNDCNGEVDDVPGGCVNGQPGCIPQPELCNGLDDDCDGFPDENNPQGGGACTASDTQRIYSGKLACVNGQLVCWAFDNPAGGPGIKNPNGAGCAMTKSEPRGCLPLLSLGLLLVFWGHRRHRRPFH